MRITDVVKGDPTLKNSVVEVASLRALSGDSVFWLVGYGETSLQWASPKSISTEGVSYLRGLSGLPERGPQRLAHFLRFLQHPDELVAADAYNEFAEASLEDIAGLRDKLDRQWVIAQLRDVSLPRHRRRLCWTFLSQCGTAADVSLFDDSLGNRRVDATFDPGMDAAISCFIALGGERALTRIERDYLANPDAEYLDSFAAISAIRVHGTELKVIPRERLAKALRHVLARSELADLVIPDLARWGDWSAIDRMVELFEASTEQTSFLRPATVLYLKTCPLPAAAEALDKLRSVDSKAVQLAESSMMLYSGVASVPVPPPDSDDPAPAGMAEPASPRVAEKPREPRTVTEDSVRE
ncbi:MAG: hypothetical protein MI861_16245 [Pirellulales bacterium]|nr:hypothetical protein [Pirellulales bacterium]